MIAGMQKRLSAFPSIVLDGQTFTLTALVKVLADEMDAASATLVAEGAFHKAVAAEKAAVAAGEPVFRALRAFVLNQFKGQADVLADFGITVVARQKPNAETQAAAVQKRQATRKARGTGGKRQKAKVTGTAQATPAPAPTAVKPA
jgi:hypothetical protein